jgi:hypothetical protein
VGLEQQKTLYRWYPFLFSIELYRAQIKKTPIAYCGGLNVLNAFFLPQAYFLASGKGDNVYTKPDRSSTIFSLPLALSMR